MAKNKKEKKGKILLILASIVIGIAILIFFPIFVHNGIRTFVEEPKLEVYCENVTIEILVNSCDNFTIQPTPTDYRKPYVNNCWCEQTCDEKACKTTNKCHMTNPEYTKCSDLWDKDSEKYRKTYFIAAIIIGLIGIIVGLYLKNAPVSLGLMGGSIVIMIIGTAQYWGEMSDRTKFIFSGIVLIVLTLIAYKKIYKALNS